jgi:hypothetical protein
MPADLHAWQQSLDLFAPEFRTVLADLALQLSGLLFPVETEAEEGEPDGWSEVHTRGSLDRLLLSEWALLEKFPLEFSRRLTQNESLYWKVAYTAPNARKNCLVLLDAGPEQLGACRLVQLALLILFQQKTTETQADLRWEVAQRLSERTLLTGGDPPQERLTEAGVRVFLDSRSVTAARTDHISQFFEHFGSSGAYMIGGAPFLQKAPRGVKRVFVHQPDQFTVSVGMGPDQVSLRLPRSNFAVKLLRDPFPTKRLTTEGSIVNAQEMAFSACGRRLVFPLSNPLQTLPIPNSPRDQQAPSRKHTVGLNRRLVAWGSTGRTVFLLTCAPGSPGVWQLSSSSLQNKPEYKVPADLVSHDFKPGRLWRSQDGLGRACLLVQLEDQLFSLNEVENQPFPPVLTHVQCCFPSPKRPRFLHDGNLFSWTGGQFGAEGSIHADGIEQVFLGQGGSLNHSTWECLAAFEVDPKAGMWRILGVQAWRVEARGRVLGVVGLSCRRASPALVVWRDGEIWLQGPDWTEHLNIERNPDQVVVSHHGSQIAYTKHDRICVFDLGRQINVLDVRNFLQ